MQNQLDREGQPETGAMISIGALSRACGIPVETLRTWERRYGFPSPDRKPSGHRLYPVTGIPRLRRIAEAIAYGHRAGDVIHSNESELEALLDTVRGRGVTPIGHPTPAMYGREFDLGECLDAVQSLDSERLTRRLLFAWATLGPLPFLRDALAPLLRASDEAWERGRFELRHVRFLSCRVGDLLSALRLSYDERATGPVIVFATMPGEPETVGLQMDALALAVSGHRVVMLGTEVSPSQVALAARERRARAVVLDISDDHGSEAVLAQVAVLRDELPEETSLVVGGTGAPDMPGIDVVNGFEELQQRISRLQASRLARNSH